MSRRLLAFNPETEGWQRESLRVRPVAASVDGSSVVGESEEMEHAVKLLELTSEQDLDRFFSAVISSVSRSVRKRIDPRTEQNLRVLLRGAARQLIPLLDHAARGFGASGAADLGGRFGHAVGPMFGLELEGLSPEDQEFETAKNFVRFVGEAAAKAANATAAPPDAAARLAFAAAAKRYAPGLSSAPPAKPRSNVGAVF